MGDPPVGVGTPMGATPSPFQFDAATLRPGPQQLRALRLAALDPSEAHRRDTEPQQQPVPNTEVQPQAVVTGGAQ